MIPATSVRPVTVSSTFLASNQSPGLILTSALICSDGEVAQFARRLDRAELVARPFLDDVGDDEVAAIGGQFGQRRDDAEIGITLRQVESAQLLLVGGEAIGIIAVVRLEQPEHAAGFLGVHFLLQATVGKLVVADDVDRADLGLVALGDLEHQVDAVLVELDDLGFDRGGEAALALVQFDDPVDVGADLRTGEDLARGKPDLGLDLVVLDPLVALQHDAVDDRIFAHLDDDRAGVGAEELDVGEQFGRVEILQRRIERLGGIGLAGRRGWRSCGSSRPRAARRPRTEMLRIVPELAARGATGAARSRARRCGRGAAGAGARLRHERNAPSAEDRADEEHAGRTLRNWYCCWKSRVPA